MENKIAGFYMLKNQIAKGSTGSIFSVTHCKTGKKFAAKIENDGISKLQYESRLYKLFQGTEGFIQTYIFCNELNKNILIFDLLGESVQHYFELNQKHLPMHSALMIVEQVITRLEVIHSKNFVHRDLKPQHLMTGLSSDSQTVFLIDLTSMKLFRHSKSGLHIKAKKGKSCSDLFSSAWVSLGYQYSRRDDLESLWFIFLYLVLGGLPWETRDYSSDDRKSQNLELKLNFFNSLAVEDFPPDVKNLFSYTRNMKFDSKPDYSYIRSKIRLLLKAFNVKPLTRIFEALFSQQDQVEDDGKIDESYLESNEKSMEISEKSLEKIENYDGNSSDSNLIQNSEILGNQRGDESSNFKMENEEIDEESKDRKIVVSRCPSSCISQSSSTSNMILNFNIPVSPPLSNNSISDVSLSLSRIEKSTEL